MDNYYMSTTPGWNINIFNRVDWDSHHRAFRRLTRFQRISVTKLVHQLSNTNRQNKLLYDKPDMCPCCGTQEETFQHVLKCTSASTQSARQEALLRLEKLLVTIGTPALVISVIMGGFRDWLDPAFQETRRSRPATFGSLRPVDILITQAYTEQFHSIGWYQFCLGRISNRWHKAVQASLPCPQT
jgi:hypothetical protein